MNIFFSPSKQSFYDNELEYSDIPKDLVPVDNDQHFELLTKLNAGCYIDENLQASPPRPDIYHNYIDGKWVDPRTSEEKRAQYLSSRPSLDRNKLKIALLDENIYSRVDAAIESIEDEKERFTVLIEWQEAPRFKRLSVPLNILFKKLGLSESKIDMIWEKALKL